MSLARARTRTARSRGKHTNHEATTISSSIGHHRTIYIHCTSMLSLPSSSVCSLFLAASCLFWRRLSFFRSLLNCLWLKYFKDHLRWPNTVFAHALADVIQRPYKYCKHILNTNMLSIQWSFYSLNAHTFCAIFLQNWTQCINSLLSLLSQRYVRKVIDAKNPEIPRFFFENEITQWKAVYP